MSLEAVPVVDKPESSASTNNTSTESKSEKEITMAPKPFIQQESAKIGGQWEQLKESEGWAEKVKNVILHPVAALSVFYKERQMGLADSQLEYWKQEEAETLAKIAKTQSGIDKSGAIHSSLQRVQAEAGITLDQKKFREGNRDAALGKAKTFQETRVNNLTFVQDKIRDIEEKKSKFTHERDMGRKVFIDSYAAKVDVETRRMSEYDEHILKVDDAIGSCRLRGAKIQQLIEQLEQENREDLLGHDDAEYVETMRQLGKQENDLSVELAKYSAARKQLSSEKEGVAKQKEFWEAKITPPKQKEAQKEKAKEDIDPADFNESLAPVHAENKATISPQPITLERSEDRMHEGWEGAREEEREYMGELLVDAQTKYETKYPKSKLFKWFLVFFKLFSESGKEKPKTTK